MHDLETSISTWRLQMLAAGIKSPELLDELESHLRDEIERRCSSGEEERHAFEGAVRQLGRAGALRVEFAKVGVERRQAWGILGLGMLISLAGASTLYELPAGQLTFGKLALGACACLMFPLLLLLGWRHAHRYLPVLSQRQDACVKLLGLALGFACTAALQANLIEPLRERDPGLFAIAFLWGWMPMILGAGLIFALNEAAHQRAKAVL